MKALKFTLSLSAVLNLGSVSAQVLAPMNPMTNLVTNPTNALWDFSKLTNEFQNVDFTVFKVSHGATNTQAEFAYADPFTQDGHGKFSGSGSTAVALTTPFNSDAPTTTNTFTYKVNGSVTSSKEMVKIEFTTKVSGAAELRGKTRNVKGSATYVVSVDNVTGEVTGRQATHASASGLGSVSSSTSLGPNLLTNYMAEIGDGTWTLALDSVSLGDNGQSGGLSGTATVTLNSGTVYPFNFTGTFAPNPSDSKRNGESKLNLIGRDNASGSMLLVTLDTANYLFLNNGPGYSSALGYWVQSNKVTQIVGQVSGQMVKFSQ